MKTESEIRRAIEACEVIAIAHEPARQNMLCLVAALNWVVGIELKAQNPVDMAIELYRDAKRRHAEAN